MKKTLLFLVLILCIGCEQAVQEVVEPTVTVESLTLKTDKQLYHSSEIMEITSKVTCSKPVEDAEVRFYGINSNRNRLDETKTVNLQEGENTITHEFQTPRCNTCSGIKEGNYKVNVNIKKDDADLISASTDVEIKR